MTQNNFVDVATQVACIKMLGLSEFRICKPKRLTFSKFLSTIHEKKLCGLQKLQHACIELFLLSECSARTWKTWRMMSLSKRLFFCSNLFWHHLHWMLLQKGLVFRSPSACVAFGISSSVVLFLNESKCLWWETLRCCWVLFKRKTLQTCKKQRSGHYKKSAPNEQSPGVVKLESVKWFCWRPKVTVRPLRDFVIFWLYFHEHFKG